MIYWSEATITRQNRTLHFYKTYICSSLEFIFIRLANSCLGIEIGHENHFGILISENEILKPKMRQIVPKSMNMHYYTLDYPETFPFCCYSFSLRFIDMSVIRHICWDTHLQQECVNADLSLIQATYNAHTCS